jgi:hypothetical protein
MKLRSRFPNWIRRKAKDESGLVSVEFAIATPLMLCLAVFVIDATAAFLTHASMWRDANQLTRGLANGELSPVQAEALATQTLGYEFRATMIDRVVRVELTMPLALIGSGVFLVPFGNLQAVVQHRVEPQVQRWS